MKSKSLIYESHLNYFLNTLGNIVSAIVPLPCKKIPKVVNSILIIKPDQLGDVLMTTAFLPLIKTKYQGANIDFVVGRWTQCVLEGNSLVRSIFFLDHIMQNRNVTNIFSLFGPFLRMISDVFSLVLIARRNKYDLVINMRAHRWNCSFLNFIYFNSFRLGFGTQGFQKWYSLYSGYDEKKHFIENVSDMLSLVDCNDSAQKKEYHYFIKPKEMKIIEEWLKKNRIEKYIVVHVGAGIVEKRLDKSKWETICSSIENLPLLICGVGSEDWQIAEHLVKFVNKKVVNCVGLFSINCLYALMCLSDKVYCLDSFSGHLASCAKVPVTVYYVNGVTSPENWKPWGDGVVCCVVD